MTILYLVNESSRSTEKIKTTEVFKALIDGLCFSILVNIFNISPFAKFNSSLFHHSVLVDLNVSMMMH